MSRIPHAALGKRLYLYSLIHLCCSSQEFQDNDNEGAHLKGTRNSQRAGVRARSCNVRAVSCASRCRAGFVVHLYFRIMTDPISTHRSIMYLDCNPYPIIRFIATLTKPPAVLHTLSWCNNTSEDYGIHKLQDLDEAMGLEQWYGGRKAL